MRVLIGGNAIRQSHALHPTPHGHVRCHCQLARRRPRMHNAPGRGGTRSPWPPAKPASVMGAETIRAQPPTGQTELSFLSVATRTPYVTDYPGEDAGKTAHYMLRWVAATGEKGPRSETASATIGALRDGGRCPHYGTGELDGVVALGQAMGSRRNRIRGAKACSKSSSSLSSGSFSPSSR